MKNKNTVAIIIGIGSYNDIGLIRSNGEAGVMSIYINTCHYNIVPIWRSKYIIAFKYIESFEAIYNYIQDFAKENPTKRIVLYGASDAAALFLDSKYNCFLGNITIPHASGKMEKLMDKELMGKMARESGLITPETRTIDLEKSQKSSRFPIILKPVESVLGSKSDIVICFDNQEYIRALNHLSDIGYKTILEQQYINSDNSKEIGITGIAYPNGYIEIYGYIDKIRNRCNVNNFGVYYPMADISLVKEALIRYIRLTGFVGIFDTDFIKDGEKWYFIECNFRNGAYGYCVTKAGFNMPERFTMNKVLPIDTNLRKICFMEERTDILNLLDGTISVYKWLKDIIRVDTFLWWNWRDPKPMLRVPSFVKKVFRVKK